MHRLHSIVLKLLIPLSFGALFAQGDAAFSETSQLQAYAAAMQIEESAKASDSPFAWQQAAQAWVKHYPNMVQSHEEKVLAAKRSTACSVKAYEAAARSGNKDAMSTASEQLFQAYGRMQTIEPNNPAWHYLLGVGYTYNGDYISARQSLSEAVKMAPNSDVAKKAIIVANHNLPAVRQAQAAHDAYENSPRGKMAKQLDENMRQANLYGATHPATERGPIDDPYFRYKQYNNNHAPQTFDSWKSNGSPY
jgi:tetratricopeptide (TPR) repeat protein